MVVKSKYEQTRMKWVVLANVTPSKNVKLVSSCVHLTIGAWYSAELEHTLQQSLMLNALAKY